MEKFTRRFSLPFGPGKLMSCVKHRNPRQLHELPKYEAGQILFESETHVWCLVEPTDLLLLSEALELKLAQEIQASSSLLLFSRVFSASFIHWSAEVCVGDFLEDLAHDPEVIRMGIDLNHVSAPSLTENCLRFFVWSRDDSQAGISEVSLDLTSCKIELKKMASWKLMAMRVIQVDG